MAESSDRGCGGKGGLSSVEKSGAVDLVDIDGLAEPSTTVEFSSFWDLERDNEEKLTNEFKELNGLLRFLLVRDGAFGSGVSSIGVFAVICTSGMRTLYGTT